MSQATTPPVHCGEPMGATARGWICRDCLTEYRDQTPAQVEADRRFRCWQRWCENRDAVDRGEPPPHAMTPEDLAVAREVDKRRRPPAAPGSPPPSTDDAPDSRGP